MHTEFVNSGLLRGLSSQVKSDIFGQGRVRELAAGEHLIRSGAPNRHLYLVLDGRLSVRLPEGDAPSTGGVTLGRRGPGSLIGEYSMLDGLKPEADVDAEVASRVFEIGHDAMHRLLNADPEISSAIYRNLLTYLVARLRAEDEELRAFPI